MSSSAAASTTSLTSVSMASATASAPLRPLCSIPSPSDAMDTALEIVKERIRSQFGIDADEICSAATSKRNR